MATTPLPVTRARRTVLVIGVPVALALIAACVPLWARGALQLVARHGHGRLLGGIQRPGPRRPSPADQQQRRLVFRTSAAARRIRSAAT